MKIVTLLKTGTGCFWTVPILTTLRDDGHDVVVALPDLASPLAQRLRAEHIPVVASPAPIAARSPLRRANAVRRLRALLRRLDPDVLYYHLYTAAVLARVASAGLRPARVHMVAGPLYLENRLINRVERVFARADDLIICSSGHLWERYRRLGVPAARLRQIPYGVDLERFQPADHDTQAKARADLGLDPDVFLAVCVAYFYPPKRLVHRGRGIKGHETLLLAWSAYHAAGGPGTLVLVGGGLGPGSDAYYQRVRTWAADLPGAGSVRWVGPTPDCAPYYAAADVSVSPSLSDNYGAPAEASAGGVPSIASAVGALLELVDGETGWLVPPGDPAPLTAALRAAAAAWADGGLPARGAAARRRAELLVDLRVCRRDAADAIVAAGRAGRRGTGRRETGRPGTGRHTA